MTDLLLVNAFCQANILKGFRYLDDAGKIMNKYDADFKEKSVGVSGMHLASKDKNATLKEMRVSSKQIWLSFAKPDTMQYVIDHASARIKDVAEILDVGTASRFGVRLEHLYPVRDAGVATPSAAKAVFKASILAGASPVSSFEAAIDTIAKGLSVALRVRPVRRQVTPEQEDMLPEVAIMFDTDIFQTGDALPITEVRKFLMSGSRWVKSSLFPLAKEVMSEVEIG